MKHTPGKWSIDTNRMVSINDAAQSDNWVAVGLSDDDGFSEIVAMTTPENAPLITAAPEMYEAITKSLEWLEGIVHNANNTNDAQDLIIDSMPADFGLNQLRRLLAEIDRPEE